MSETGSISIQYRNILSDHLHAGRLYYSHGSWAKIDKVVAVMLVGMGLWATFALGIYWWTIIWFPLGFVEWFNLLSPRPLMVYMFFKRNPKFLEPYDITFNETDIYFKTASIDSRIAWTQYNEVIESQRIFLLIYGKGMYSVIPKSAFKDTKQIDAFRDLLDRKINSKNEGE